MNIEDIKNEIVKCNKLSDIGLEIYQRNKDSEFLHNAVYFGSEADKLKILLKEEYGIII